MLSGCKILQYICAIIIVLLILTTIMLLIGAVSLSGKASTTTGTPNNTAGLAGYGTAAIIIWAGINIGITALFMKVYRDCAKVQDVLEKRNLSRKPKELALALDSMKGMVDVGKAASESLAASPVVSESQMD